MGSTIPKYMQTLHQSADNAEIQRATVTMFREAGDIVFPGKKVVIKDDVEPQCEIEEVKQDDMEIMDEYINEMKLFNQAVKNYDIVYEEDLLQLKDAKQVFIQQN